MFLFRRAMLAPTLAIAFAAVCGVLAEPARAAEGEGGVRALSSADRLSYTTAFDALRRGDLELARAAAREARDRVLLGQVEFERLFHPDYSATYEELTAWLDEYADLPCAERAYNLALRRRPDGAAEPRRPNGVGPRTWNSVVTAGGGALPDDPVKQARIAYNNDDLPRAYTLGVQIGDWWTAGLAAWRLNQFNDSLTAFDRVASDPTQDGWVRAGAAVWAARAAGRTGRQDQVTGYLQVAAHWPATFYGQIALRQLGVEPDIHNMGPRPYQPGGGLQQASWRPGDTSDVDPGELEAFVQSDQRARRTLAFYEVGRRSEAEDELKTGVRMAPTDSARRLWTALANMIRPRSASSTDGSVIDAAAYPVPVLEPEGGFTIERALVYAIARKETGFNANARSGVGAYGMMQLMPGTAAELSGDRGFVTQPNRLLQPAVNLRLGQAYVNRMFQLPAFQGDLLRAVASYNAGPGPMLAAVRKLGPDADPLLLIETIDVPQARDYVEKVVAAYWIYQRMFGGPLNTLDAVASGATAVPISLDYVPPPPAPVAPAAPVDIAAVPATAGGR